MTEIDTKSLLKLIDSAYLAGLGKITWDDFTRQFGDEFPEFVVLLAGYDNRVKSAELLATANMEEWAINDYVNHYHKINPYLTKSHLWRSFPEITEARDLYTNEEIFNSDFYKNYLTKFSPLSVHEGFAGVIYREDSRFLALTCNHAEKDRPAAQRAMAMLRVLGPHLQRAFELYRQLEGQRIYTSTLESSFNLIKAGLFVVDQDAVLDFANQRGEKMLRSGEVVYFKDKKIKFRSPLDETEVLSELNVLRRYDPTQSPRLVRLQLPEDNPYIAFVSVLADSVSEARLSPRESLLIQHRLVLFLIDPSEHPIIAIETIVAAINCTKAEASLAQSLIMGLNLNKHAEKTGISYNTVRSQLQALFQKTETHSQPELIAHLIRITGFLQV